MEERDRTGLQEDERDDVYTVTEITEAIRQQLETEFPAVRVIGEIANFKAHTSGHFYFSIRDGKNSLRIVLFRRYSGALSFGPENGQLVIASGRISHYGGSGQTQLIATEITPAGRGTMELEYRRLLQKLMDEGHTAAERKRPVAAYPKRLVVVTSPTGAVIRDIIDTLRRRWPVAEVVHIGAEVQGTGAAASIVRAFKRSNRLMDVDAVILARGGGSVEDLWTFNTDEVARAVADSVHPVITGIGHEIDTTIADYVSDIHAATPTAAAELATPHIDDVKSLLDGYLSGLGRLVRESARHRLGHLEYLLRSSVFPALVHRLERAELVLDDLGGRLCHWWRSTQSEELSGIESRRIRIERAMERSFRMLDGRLSRSLEKLFRAKPAERMSASRESVRRLRHLLRERVKGAVALRRRGLEGMLRNVDGLCPLSILERGYTFCTTVDGDTVLRGVGSVKPGDDIMVNFHDGGARCKVESRKRGKPW